MSAFQSMGPKTGRLTCGGPGTLGGGCGATSRPVAHPGGAAPEVHVALALRKEGWSDNCGSFYGMLQGISALCPECTKRAQAAARACVQETT